VPHPERGFTQGLIADGGVVWESTGNYGRSQLRRYEFGADAVAVRTELPPELFGEGICRVGDSVWQLTWRERVALRWDAGTFALREKVRYNRDGWGICAADGEVVTSDGTGEVVYVRCEGSRVRGLNDLAWAGGLVWANVAGTACLAGIDLATGEITDVTDARAAAERHWADQQAIMNGIAALSRPDEFLLTGKTWRAVRHVRLVPDRDRGHRERLLAGLSR
jgi:glutaminyl-peptide cyclotransferase